MTLIITRPETGEPFGPGFRLEATSTFVGPLEPDSYWLITLTAPANEDVMLTMTVPTDINALNTVVVRGSIEFPFIVEGRTPWVTGEAAQIQVDLVEPIGGVLETTTTQVILDRQTGQNAELQTWIQQQLLAQPVGLTTEQGEQLTRVESSIAFSTGINPLELIGDVVQAIATHNPLGYGSLTIAYTLTGDGEMPNETPLNVKWGVYWIATVIPTGLGHRHGQSEEYPARLIQWRTTHFIDEIEMVSAVVDFETHGELWKFPVQTPNRLEYSILPGVTIEARWWQFP